MIANAFVKNLSLAIASAVLLSACGEGESAGKTATQVAARVNSEELSVHQINAVLSRTPNLQPDQVEAAGQAALERLIDQELLVQRAKDKKLDRDPRVMQAIEAARREILARSYMEQFTGQADKPAPGEIQAFYDENPALFSERRVYNLQELNITIDADKLGELREAVTAASSLNDIVNWLRERKIPFKAGGGVRAAEQLPLEALPRFAQMKDGQIGLVQTRTGVLAIFLAGSRAQPLDVAAATPFIERFLLNREKTEMARAEMKRLRDTAQIEYMGNFKAPTQGQATVEEVVPAAASSTESEGGLSAETLEKGVSGLK
ncbi:MAG: EpsD family peptidyl-prolyl cis-trans isomerase [Rhodocyclaceae bacterium]|nr:EpsD family peptidyl-prolyl cis-trans isomerase [Rhodocyclaceae bacterium]MCB1963448.1 EpsD family peptidyl-prolyl cis-trans isomerase [Rhodocyclaceae bacterium]